MDEMQAEVTNNQTDSAQAEESQNVSHETIEEVQGTDAGATPAAGETKPEFSDPNMQSKFTQKMQELSEQRKQFDSEKETLYEIARAYKTIVNHPEYQTFHSKAFEKKQEEAKLEIPEISDDDFERLTTDKTTFQKSVVEMASKIAQHQVKPLMDKLMETSKVQESTMLKNDIKDYANEKPDFWKLDEEGLIEPLMLKFSQQFPKASNLEIVDKAYKQAKSMVEKIRSSAEKEAMTKSHKLVEQKKQAIGETGRPESTSAKKITDAKTIGEIMEQAAEEVGYKWVK